MIKKKQHSQSKYQNPFPLTQLTTPYFILKHTTENETQNHQKKKKKKLKLKERKTLSLLFEDSDRVVVKVEQSDLCGPTDPVLLRVVDGQNDRHRHVHGRPVREPERVEMKRLEELIFSHESTERACPAFAQHVDPLKINPGEPDSRKREGLPLLHISQRLVHQKLHELPTVRFDQPRRNSEPPVGFSARGKRYGDFQGRGEMGIRYFVMGVRRVWGFGEEGSHGSHWRWETNNRLSFKYSKFCLFRDYNN
jgi:hypothetical protein